MNSRVLVVTAVVGILVLGGAFFGWKWYSGNQPAFRGRAVPMALLKPELKDELTTQWKSTFETVVKNEELLQEVVEESDYASRMGVPEGEAVAHLKEAIRVRFKNRNDSLEYGLVGKRKQDDTLSEISKVLCARVEGEVATIEPSFGEYLEALVKAREQQQEASE